MPIFSLLPSLLLTEVATAQDDVDPAALAEVEQGFVRHFVVTTPQSVDLDATREWVELELRNWGLDISNCDYLRQLDQALDADIAENYPSWRFDEDLVTDKRVLSARCLPRTEESLFYVVKVSLDADPDLGGQKRASVQLLPVGPGASQRRSFTGGYAHRPFAERPSWNEVIARAVQRAIGGLDEPPSIVVRGPDKARVGKDVLFDAGESWDPDGDPFLLDWVATVPACKRRLKDREILLPRAGEQCADRDVPVDHEIRLPAGETGRDRRLTPPITGIYTIRATPRAGPRVLEGGAEVDLWVKPRHPHLMSVTIGAMPIPDGFLEEGRGPAPFLLTSLVYRYRVGHGAFLGLTTESFLGVHAGVVNTGFDGRSAGAWTFGIDSTNRSSGSRGRVGFEQGVRLGAGPALTRSNGVASEQALLYAQFRAGPFLSFREANRDVTDRDCTAWCTSFHLGGTATGLYRVDTERVVVSLGAVLDTSVSF